MPQKRRLKHASFDSRGCESQYHRCFRDVSSFLFAFSVSNLFKLSERAKNKDSHWCEVQSHCGKGL